MGNALDHEAGEDAAETADVEALVAVDHDEDACIVVVVDVEHVGFAKMEGFGYKPYQYQAQKR